MVHEVKGGKEHTSDSDSRRTEGARKQQVYKSSDGVAKLIETIGMIGENMKFISLMTEVINQLSNEY